MNESQARQLQAEVQRLRAEVQTLAKAIQLRDADSAAITTVIQGLLNATLLVPQAAEPLALAIRAGHLLQKDKPGCTALYREHYDAAIQSILPDHLKPLVLQN
jgi:hypothetical protein